VIRISGRYSIDQKSLYLLIPFRDQVNVARFRKYIFALMNLFSDNLKNTRTVCILERIRVYEIGQFKSTPCMYVSLEEEEEEEKEEEMMHVHP